MCVCVFICACACVCLYVCLHVGGMCLAQSTWRFISFLDYLLFHFFVKNILLSVFSGLAHYWIFLSYFLPSPYPPLISPIWNTAVSFVVNRGQRRPMALGVRWTHCLFSIILCARSAWLSVVQWYAFLQRSGWLHQQSLESSPWICRQQVKSTLNFASAVLQLQFY